MKILAKLKDEQYELTSITHTRKIVRGVIMNENKQIALIYIKGEDKFGIRDYYELPGGGKKRFESFKNGLRREILEEIGARIIHIRKVGRIIDYYNLINRKNDNHYYLATLKGPITKTALEPYEEEIFMGVKWVSIDEALELYEKKNITPLGKLLYNREVIILKEVKRLLID